MCQSNSPSETSSKNSENHSYSSGRDPEQPLPYVFFTLQIYLNYLSENHSPAHVGTPSKVDVEALQK